MRRPRPSETAAEIQDLFDILASLDAGAPIPDQILELLQSGRARSADMAMAIDRAFVTRMGELRDGLMRARTSLDELRGNLEALSFTPWYPAVFLGPAEFGPSASAMVFCNGAPRLVGLADGVTLEGLSVGDDVLLGKEMNVIMCRVASPWPRTGETAAFQRTLPDGRLVVRHRDEDLIGRAAGNLDTGALSEGDQVRWDRSVGLAYEHVERARGSHLFLEDTPPESFDSIGGLDAQIALITRSLGLHMHSPETAVRYGVRRVGSILLVGPPGTGKTMVARALAHWLAEQAPSGRAHFMSIKPGELHSVWYGRSEQNYREAFRLARQAGDADPSTPVVMFFDEVEAVGRARGQSLGHVDDRVLTSFMTELDGLEARGNVVVVGATNRRDTLDPALARPGRLGDLVVDIPRPNMTAAAAILARHLPLSVPCAEEGSGGRQEVIDRVVSRLYAPNGEGELASIMFRDGTRRTIRASDLVSGAHLANIARAALQQACQRDVDGGLPGLTSADALDAIGDELGAAVAALTPANCHAFVSDLPQDLAVTRVDPIVRPVRRPHRFRRVA